MSLARTSFGIDSNKEKLVGCGAGCFVVGVGSTFVGGDTNRFVGFAMVRCNREAATSDKETCPERDEMSSL